MKASRLPRATARAIDRLAARAHFFHRFAHHPLCERYAGELVSLGGRQRVCRGCAAVLLGVPSGVVACALLQPSVAVVVAAVGLGGLCGALSLRVRLPKTLGRFVPSALLSLGLAAAALRAPVWGLGLLGLVLILGLSYRQRRPDRTPCATCPERQRPVTCSGFLPIVRRERAFQRVAQRLIDRGSVST